MGQILFITRRLIEVCWVIQRVAHVTHSKQTSLNRGRSTLVSRLKISVLFGSANIHRFGLRLNGELDSEKHWVIARFASLLIKEVDFGLSFENSHSRSIMVLKFVKVTQKLVEVKHRRFERVVAVFHQSNHVWCQDIFELESFVKEQREVLGSQLACSWFSLIKSECVYYWQFTLC